MNIFSHIEQCSSTNDEILNIINTDSEEDIFTLYTFNQTQGRGQYGNSWLSNSDKNLAFSIAFRCNKINLPYHLFNFHTANVLREFIAKKTDAKVEVKWPNDIITSRKKISGMLIERIKRLESDFYVLGIGINILQEDFLNLPKAGSILTQTSLRFNLHEWAKEMNEFLINNLFGEKKEEQILEDYNKNLFRKDIISVFEIKGDRQNGIIKKVDNDGFLWVELEHSGLKKFYHKEIELLY